MASASAIKAGETFVTMSLEAGEMEKNLKQITRKLNNFAASAAKIGTVLTAIGGVGAAGLTKAAMEANKVELVGRRLDAVFRDAADEARKFARVLAVEIGDSRFAVEDTLVTFKSFFAEIVASEQDQIGFSRRMTELSRDFAAFQGMDTTEALQRFISALSGSPEVLDRFGINLKAAALDAEFAAKGLDVTTESAREFEKVVARMDIIERTLTKQGAIGKAQKELKTFSGALRAAASSVRDFTVAIGQALLPVLRPVIAMFANLVRGFEALATHAPLLSVAFGVIVVGTTAMGVSILAAAGAATALALALTLATTAVTQYNGYVKKAKLEGASFTAVLRHAKNEAVGFGIGAAKAGAGAMGFGVSTQAVTSGLMKMRVALASTVVVMGKMVALTSLMSVALGTVPDSGLGIAVAFAAAGAASMLFSRAIDHVRNAAAQASLTLSAYNATVWTNASASKKAALWTEVFANKLGIKSKYIAKAGRALRWLKPLVAAVGAVLTPMGLLVAGIAAGLAVLVGIVFRFGQLLSYVTGSTRRLGDAWKWLKGQMEDIAWISKVADGVEWLADKVDGLWDRMQVGLKRYREEAAEGLDFLVTGEITARRRGASDKGGSFERQSQEEIDEAKSVADRIRELDRRIHDARMAQIKDQYAREKAEAQAQFDREVADIRRTAQEKVMANRMSEIDALKESGVSGGELVRRLREINQKVPEALAAEMEKSAEIINRLEEELGVKRMDIAERQAEDRMKLDRRLQSDLARSRLAGIYEGAALEMAALKQKHKDELAETKLGFEQLAMLKERQANDEANLINRFARDAERLAGDAWADVQREGQLAGIEDENVREQTALWMDYQDVVAGLQSKLSEASALLATLGGEQAAQVEAQIAAIQSQVEAEKTLYQIRLDALKKLQDKEKEMMEERRAASLESLDDEIARLKVELNTEDGLERRLALLDLARKNAIRDAEGDEDIIKRVNDAFDLRVRAAKQGAINQGDRIAGATDFRQISALSGPSGNEDEQLELAKEAKEQRKKQLELMRELVQQDLMRA